MADVDRQYVALLVDTTHVYPEVDLEMKTKALAQCDVPGTATVRQWIKSPDVMAFLKAL